nr:replication-associated recombination protein A [Litorimonas taeanensis]
MADALRPTTLGEVIGQDHLLAEGAPLRRMLDSGRLSSLILWGPPGVGKTTLARIIADHADMEFVQLSAVFSGVADLRKVFETATARRSTGRGTLLFVDEIHRFNKSQQDGFLPYVENGTITLIGATTENPSFELNSALLSRAQVYVLKRLDDAALSGLLKRAELHLKKRLPVTEEGRQAIIDMADGDGRYSLSLAEILFNYAEGSHYDADGVAQILQKRRAHYDKGGEHHYNLISALHKSIRGSDPDAALYWLARMLGGGEDPIYLARRLVRMASEDIGLADPTALPAAMASLSAYQLLGTPEGELALAQTVVHLASAPKSNAVYVAFKAAQRSANETGSLAPPAHIMNAPTKLMKDLGYGAGYQYDPDTVEGFSGQDYFPEGMSRQTFYQPKGDGAEKDISERLTHWENLRMLKKSDPR